MGRLNSGPSRRHIRPDSGAVGKATLKRDVSGSFRSRQGARLTRVDKFAEKTADFVERFFGFEARQARFESGNDRVQHVGFCRAVDTEADFKRAIQYRDRVIARMKG